MSTDTDKIIDDLKYHKENLSPAFLAYLSDYDNFFVQRLPWYAVKPLGDGHWRTKHKPLSDPTVLAHLYGKYYVGSLARWYPEFCIIDIDDREKSKAEDIRASGSLYDTNSIMIASQSANSFHILFRPQLNGLPPTIDRLHTAMKAWAKDKGVEIYPQRHRVIRLPFGPHQFLLDEELSHLTSWTEKLYWFQKLDPFDLEQVEGQQMELPLTHNELIKAQFNHQLSSSSWNDKPEYLLTHGLQSPSTREYSQFVILLYFFRKNVAQDISERIVWKWIFSKHNDYSETINKHPDEVRRHIHRQASSIYSNYDLAAVYPDSTHNQHNGFICRPDIDEIIRFTGGNMPRMKFLFNLLKYSYPRHNRNFINIHSDKLRTWAGVRTSLKYLDELESKGIVKRGTAYRPDAYSKDLKLNWPYRSSNEAILFSGRSLDELDSTFKLAYKPQELRELLLTTGVKRTTAIEVIRAVYEGVKKGTTL